MRCEKCNKEHDGSYGSGRFCCRACANSRKKSFEERKRVSLSLGGNGVLKLLNPIRTSCLNCRKIFSKPARKKFCDHKCQWEHDWKLRSAQWRKDKDFKIAHQQTGGQINHVKKFLAEERGRKCEICSRTEWNAQPIPLILDHINGHADDWKIKNVRLVCPNCDALLPTYCGRNKGNGTRKFVLRAFN